MLRARLPPGRDLPSRDLQRTSTLVAAVEALGAGVTSVFNWSTTSNPPAHADAAIHALQDAEIRAVYARGNSDEAADVRRLRGQLGESERVMLGLELVGPELGPTEATAAGIEFARASRSPSR